MDFGETLMLTPDNVVLSPKSDKDLIYNEKWELVENRIAKTNKPSLTLAQNASRAMSIVRNIVERVNARILWQNKACNLTCILAATNVPLPADF